MVVMKVRDEGLGDGGVSTEGERAALVGFDKSDAEKGDDGSYGDDGEGLQNLITQRLPCQRLLHLPTPPPHLSLCLSVSVSVSLCLLYGNIKSPST